MSDWTEVGGGDSANETWNREGEIVGKYVNKQTGVGPNKSNLYTLETDKGSIAVWGSTVLDTKFESIALGSMVKIESLGKVKSTRGTEYYDYKVLVKPSEPSEATVQDINDIMNS